MPRFIVSGRNASFDGWYGAKSPRVSGNVKVANTAEAKSSAGKARRTDGARRERFFVWRINVKTLIASAMRTGAGMLHFARITSYKWCENENFSASRNHLCFSFSPHIKLDLMPCKHRLAVFHRHLKNPALDRACCGPAEIGVVGGNDSRELYGTIGVDEKFNHRILFR
jgi:hypothetical protein